MTHVMVDLETLGTVPGCVILSIGAVVFDVEAQTLGEEFYCVVSTADSKMNFMEADPDTVKWWNEQSPEARKVLAEAKGPDALSIEDAAEDFNNFLSGVGKPSKVRIYGNGADFDNPILRVMYKCANVEPYAKGYTGRCYRTLKNLHELLGDDFRFDKIDRTGTYHNALDDAKSQALHLMAQLSAIRSRISGGQE